MPIDNRARKNLSPTRGQFPPSLNFNVSPKHGMRFVEPIPSTPELAELNAMIDNLDPAQVEPKTYLAMILDALSEFYQKVLEWIDYLTPSYFKSAPKELEQPSTLRNHSFLPVESLGTTPSSADEHGVTASV